MQDTKKQKDAQLSLFAKVGEVAEALDLSAPTVRAAIRRGELPGVRVGRQFLVRREALDRLLKSPNAA